MTILQFKLADDAWLSNLTPEVAAEMTDGTFHTLAVGYDDELGMLSIFLQNDKKATNNPVLHYRVLKTGVMEQLEVMRQRLIGLGYRP